MTLFTPETPKNLVIIEPCEIMRMGLSQLFKGNRLIKIAAEYESPQQLSANPPADTPDLILTEVFLDENGDISPLTQLFNEKPPQIIYFSATSDESTVIHCIQSGAAGYILKHNSKEKISRLITCVCRGEPAIDDTIYHKILNYIKKPPLTQSLKPREVKYMSLISQGLTNRQIANKLGLSEKTIKNQLMELFEKLGIRNRAQAASIYSLNVEKFRCASKD